MNRWKATLATKDTLGIIASMACAIHCAATPFLLAFLPALKFTEWMASPWFHQVAAIGCVALVSAAIIPAFYRHRDFRVLTLSIAGLGLVFAAAFCLPNECCTHQVVQTVGSESAPSFASLGGEALSVSQSNGWLAAIQPWMTPLGGFLLIAAHSLNLRYRRKPCGKNCRCHLAGNTPNKSSDGLPVVLVSTPKAA